MTTPETPADPPTPVSPTSASLPENANQPRRPLWKRIGTEALLIVVVVSMALVFAVVVLGMQLPGLTESNKDKEEKTSQDKKESEPAIKVSLVKDKAHTLNVPEETRTSLLIRKGEKDLLVDVKTPTTMRPFILPGSTALDPVRIA